jgi:hypothetical protein
MTKRIQPYLTTNLYRFPRSSFAVIFSTIRWNPLLVSPTACNYTSTAYNTQSSSHTSTNKSVKKTSNSPTKPMPSMKQFLHWKQVTALYRSFLRLVQIPRPSLGSSSNSNIDQQSLSSLKQQIQSSFRRNQYLTDGMDIQRAVQEGNRQYKQLLLMVSPAGGTRRKTAAEENSQPSSSSKDKEEEDVVGRIGIEWPWARDSK